MEDLFRLPFDFAVPDLLFHRELAGDIGDRLIALGLRVEELGPEELSRAVAVRREMSTLSTPDTFAFAIAERRSWPLLTGDGALRQFATDAGVATHGVLWICDRFEDHLILGLDHLHQGLTAISTHPRCRLPATEVRARLHRYAAG